MSTRHESVVPQSPQRVFAQSVYRDEARGDAPSDIEGLRLELRSEVRALRALMTRSGKERELSLELAAIRAVLDDIAAGPEKRNSIATWLRARGIEGVAARRIAAAAKKAEGADVTAKLRRALSEILQVAPWTYGGPRRRILTLVGPSGVGKTTTAAKIAARERMAGRTVAMVSCDGFRVGAVDQLERYADLLGSSFHVAEGGSELASILDGASEDVVIVDTSGRAPTAGGPEMTLAERRPRAANVDFQALLCVAASTRAADAARIVATFECANPTAICVTKLDETVVPSGLVHVSWAAKKAIALVCSGPRVPEDISAATFDNLFARLEGSVV